MPGLAANPVELLDLYRSHINSHCFDDVAPLIADDAIFWFNDGSFVGRTAIRAAFEATWERYPQEDYRLSDIVWIARDEHAAACTYRFRWTAVVDGLAISGGGRGTTVMRRDSPHWFIAHEHLSPLPPISPNP